MWGGNNKYDLFIKVKVKIVLRKQNWKAENSIDTLVCLNNKNQVYYRPITQRSNHFCGHKHGFTIIVNYQGYITKQIFERRDIFVFSSQMQASTPVEKYNFDRINWKYFVFQVNFNWKLKLSNKHDDEYMIRRDITENTNIQITSVQLIF